MTREEAIKIIRRYESNKEHYEACEIAIKALEQQKTEKWIEGKGADIYLYICPTCGKKVANKENFCPECGCRMAGGEK